jgi:hypothetical protein
VRLRPVSPERTRLSPYRAVKRGPGLPASLKAMLAVAILGLAATVVLVGTGTLGGILGALAGGVGGVVQQVAGAAAATSSPTAAPVVTDTAFIVAPDNPYTNVETVDVTVTVPQAALGKSGFKVRLFDTVTDKPTVVLSELPVGPTSTLLFAGVTLAAGNNGLQVALVGPDGEGGRSTVVTYVLDQVDPKITITTPRDGASVTASTVTIKGNTQPGSTVVLRNDANAATATDQADTAGLFSVGIATAAGPNAILITVTDPAGNASTRTINVVKGSGKLTVALTGSVYKFTAATLPTNVTFTVVVTGADGARVSGASALFTVTIPGLQAIVSPETATGADGRASFSTTIPAGAQAGSGLASVLVTTPSGTGTDRQSLTVQ